MRLRTFRLLLALSSLVAFPFHSPARSQTPGAEAGLEEDLGRFIRSALREWGVPGASITIVRDGRILVASGYGLADVDKGRPVTSDTIFAIGSASKAFTASVAASLVENGELDWDTRVREVVPEFQPGSSLVASEATLEDLLAHRTGIERADEIWYTDPCVRTTDVLARMRSLRPEHPFRTRFLYSNIMYSVAGEMLSRRAGLSWANLVKKVIIDPLGMHSSSTDIAALQKMTDVAVPYARRQDRLLAVPWRDLSAVAPAGAVNSTATDMAAWLKFNLGDGSAGPRRLLRKSSLEELRNPRTPARSQQEFDVIAPGATMLAYGLGWRLHDYRGRKVMDHTGGIDGFSAEVTVIPEARLGIATLSNLHGSWFPTAVKYWILQRLLGDGGDGESLEVMREARARERADGETATPKLPATTTEGASLLVGPLTGIYRHASMGDLRITSEGRALKASRSACMSGSMERAGARTFKVTWPNPFLQPGYVTFQSDAAGVVQEAWYQTAVDGRVTAYERVSR